MSVIIILYYVSTNCNVKVSSSNIDILIKTERKIEISLQK